MPSRNGPRVLAVGIDAAEPTLVRTLAEHGDMPILKTLLETGTSGSVASPAHVASIAVWPTFLSATSLWEHEKSSAWSWNPDRMAIDRETFDSLRPFWRAPELAERRIGVLDVPFVARAAPIRGFEICEWGAHDFVFGDMHVCPPALAPRIRAVAGEHPFRGPLDASASAQIPDDFLDQCLDGARRRGQLIDHLLREESPELFLVVFSETHRASHLLWHTVPGPGPGLVDLFREVDRQLGRLLELAGDDTATLVFSLHGMRETRGVPQVLDPLFRAVELATPAPEPILSRLKRRAPDALRRLYRRMVPTDTRWQLALAGLTPRYDWTRTRAFPLPTDQHGWIRVNLKGREAAGVVEPADYRRLCDEIERLLGGLRREDGAAVVRGVVRTAPSCPAGVPAHLPDLVVHWTPAANAGPFQLREPAIACELGAPRLTGQHAPDGFWVFRSPRPGGPAGGSAIATEALGRVLIRQLVGP